jgi:hypothetical protein
MLEDEPDDDAAVVEDDDPDDDDDDVEDEPLLELVLVELELPHAAIASAATSPTMIVMSCLLAELDMYLSSYSFDLPVGRLLRHVESRYLRVRFLLLSRPNGGEQRSVAVARGHQR